MGNALRCIQRRALSFGVVDVKNKNSVFSLVSLLTNKFTYSIIKQINRKSGKTKEVCYGRRKERRNRWIF